MDVNFCSINYLVKRTFSFFLFSPHFHKSSERWDDSQNKLELSGKSNGFFAVHINKKGKKIYRGLNQGKHQKINATFELLRHLHHSFSMDLSYQSRYPHARQLIYVIPTESVQTKRTETHL